MRLIEHLVEHYEALGAQRLELPEIQVDGEALVIYWTPLTVRERMQAKLSGTLTADAELDLVVIKALDATGAQLFSIEDKPLLRRKVPAHLINRIAHAMLAAPLPSFDAAKKNSKPIPTE